VPSGHVACAEIQKECVTGDRLRPKVDIPLVAAVRDIHALPLSLPNPHEAESHTFISLKREKKNVSKFLDYLVWSQHCG
jgi:hypothetical protein